MRVRAEGVISGGLPLQGARQLAEACDLQIGDGGVGAVRKDVPPWPAFDEAGEESCFMRGQDVRIEAVADVEDARRWLPGTTDHLVEEAPRGLGLPPVLGGGDQVSRKVQLTQQPPRSGSLVACKADEIALVLEHPQAGAHIGVEVAGIEMLAEARIEAALAFSVEVEATPEVLEHFAVVPALSDDGAEDSRERVTRHAEPISPCAVLGGLVDDSVTDVEEHGPYSG